MKATTKSTLGNFAVTAAFDADDRLAQILLDLGLLYVLQRQTSIDRTLGAFYTTSDGKSKRRAGWKRIDVEYSPEMADALKAALSTLALPDDGGDITPTLTVEEYVREEKEKKYAKARQAMSFHESKNDLEKWLANVIGYKGETHGEDGEFHPDALRAIDDFVAAQWKALNS